MAGEDRGHDLVFCTVSRLLGSGFVDGDFRGTDVNVLFEQLLVEDLQFQAGLVSLELPFLGA
ncbi:hypothetical protein D3C77_275050 [compost metagenome]